jgi:hypothetical protein
MKNFLIFLAAALFLLGCGNNGNDAPNVSGIRVDVPVERFDQSFFSIDSNDIPGSLRKLQQKHPGFYADFMQQVLGVDGSDSSANTILVTREFLRGYKPIYDSIQKIYASVKDIEDDLEDQFRYVKHYFPNYKTGKAIFFLGPFDAPGVAATHEGLAIGLQQYAGRDFSVYHSGPALEMFPTYISRRFSKEFIVPNVIKAIVEDLYPDRSGGKPLLEQMVEKGKEWWLLDKLMPTTHDSLKTGYTASQLEWCEANEGLIWAYLVKNEDLNSINPVIIQTYIGEGPFTQGFSQELSPGNLGQWIGWRIILKYEEKYPALTIDEIMKKPASEIINGAKYKPR